jgi:WD40 repeat protein
MTTNKDDDLSSNSTNADDDEDAELEVLFLNKRKAEKQQPAHEPEGKKIKQSISNDKNKNKDENEAEMLSARGAAMNSILGMPNEILECVFLYILPQLVTVRMVCRLWREVIDTSETLWKLNINRRWPHIQLSPAMPRHYYVDKFLNLAAIERNWNSGKCSIREIESHFGRVCAMQFNEVEIVTGGEDKSVRLHDMVTGQCLRTFYGHTEAVWALRMDREKNILCTGGGDSLIKIWQLDSPGTSRRTIHAHRGEVWCLALDVDKGFLASGSVDSLVKLWDIETGSNILQLFEHSASVFSVQLKDNILVSAGTDGKVKVVDLRSHAGPHSPHATNTLRSPVLSPIFTVQFDDRDVVTGSGDGTIKVFDRATNTLRQMLYAHRDSVWTMHMDGNKLVSGGVDKALCVINRDAGIYKFCYALHSHLEPVFVVQFDHSKIVTADGSMLQVWNFTPSTHHLYHRPQVDPYYCAGNRPNTTKKAKYNELCTKL